MRNKHYFKQLKFINPKNMNKRQRIYGTYNVIHWFSKLVKFPDMLNVLNEDEKYLLKVDDHLVNDFIVGNSSANKSKNKHFYHLQLPLHFAIKHRNQGKIESYKWFFKGFWDYMNPQYTQMIDVGSIPCWYSISTLIMHMETFKQVGGVWGEIECLIPPVKEDGTPVSFAESVILRAQYVEYKLSHYLDKALESVFGFVSVLPGAFSAYRWECINGQPINEFLKGVRDEFDDTNYILPCSEANKYLAEDRIMCLEILAKKDEEWLIHYVPGSKWYTDPPYTFTQLLKQRRRWFNGTLFVSFHVLGNMWRVWHRKSSSWFRNILIMLLYLYMFVHMILSYILVGVFFGLFSVFVRAVFPTTTCTDFTSISQIIETVYIIFLFLVLLLSVTVEVTWAEFGYRISSVVMGFFSLLMIGWAIAFAIMQELSKIGIILLLVYFLAFVVPFVFNWPRLKLFDFLKGILYVIYLTPTYINILTIYAISNLHDVSWGSRPEIKNNYNTALEREKDLLYKDYRSRFLLFWTFVNVVIGYGLVYLFQTNNAHILVYIGWGLTSIMVFKVLFSIFYTWKESWHRILVRRYIKTQVSTLFTSEDKERHEEEVQQLQVYFDENDNLIQLGQG